ncbi:hypothetical protein CFP56_041906 [Quercus suber]|uniref:Uncharacterized protein n=1 Tax=Quercus suber TaxID=58331 RepID=A0AAW0LK91_QUESU
MLGLSESGTTEQSDFDKDEEVEDNDKEEDEQQAPICSLLVPASSKPGKIEMYSPAFYAACTAGDKERKKDDIDQPATAIIIATKNRITEMVEKSLNNIL